VHACFSGAAADMASGYMYQMGLHSQRTCCYIPYTGQAAAASLLSTNMTETLDIALAYAAAAMVQRCALTVSVVPAASDAGSAELHHLNG
jgi:hypothetical protein